MASAPLRFRDIFRVPWWLADRPGRTVGYRVVWTLIAMLDAFADVMLQGLQAAWPGIGTPSALPMIGRSRGIIRGQADTHATYAEKLRRWLDYWRDAGTQRAIAVALHEYLGNGPRVRVVNRAGFMTTVDTDGTITTTTCAWDWDSSSNPERSGYWWDQWIIVYPTQWAVRGEFGGGDTVGGDALGLGHDVTRVEFDAVKGLLEQWKSAHSIVRAVIWTSDASRFDPATPASLPNGNWGQWHSGTGVSDRDTSTSRYWHPNGVT
jgi:hypothetical protein